MRTRAIILILFVATLTTKAADWVYMGLYPYMYDLNTARWSYAAAPVIWYQDVYTQEWGVIGEQPPINSLEYLPGLMIRIWSNQGEVFDIYFYIDNEASLDDPRFPGPADYIYYYEELRNDKAVIAMKDQVFGQEESITLALDFTEYAAGYFSGVILGNTTVRPIAGEFVFYTF